MAISFSGLASGMDTSSWVEALVSVKQAEITKMEQNKSTIAEAQSVLNNIKNYFSSFESLLLNITDAKMFGNSSRDLFTQNLAESSNVGILTATASTSAENTTYNIEVNQLATATEVYSGITSTIKNTEHPIATLDSTLFSLFNDYMLRIEDEDELAAKRVHAGNIKFNIDGNERTVSIDSSTTIADFLSSLDSIGVSASYNENTGIFSLGASMSVQAPAISRTIFTTGGNIATGTTTLGELGLGNSFKKNEYGQDTEEYDSSDCYFTVVDSEGKTQTITTLTKDSTLYQLFAKLEEYGIYGENSSFEDGQLTLDKSTFGGSLSYALGMTNVSRYVETDETGVLEAMGLTDVNNGYKSDLINIVTTTTVSGTASLESKLKDLFVTQEQCAFSVTPHGDTPADTGTPIEFPGEYKGATYSFTPDSTLGQVLTFLHDNFNFYYSLNDDGSLTLTTDKLGYTFSGPLAEALGFKDYEEPYVSQTRNISSDIVYSTVRTVVNRDSTLDQIGAFKPGTTGDMVIVQCDSGVGSQVVEGTIHLTSTDTVQDMFDELTAYGITGTINDGVITLDSTAGLCIQSTDNSVAKNIGILQPILNTYYTTAPMTMTSGVIDTSATLGGLAGTAMTSDGSVVIYSPVYGVVSVNIAKELRVSEFCDKINNSNFGVQASIDGNTVKIESIDSSGAYILGMSSVLQSALRFNVGEDFSYDSTTINVYSNTDSGYIEYNDTGVAINGNTVISSINNYSGGDGTMRLTIRQKDEITGQSTLTVSTITIDPTLTLDEFINNPIVGLSQYGITGQILSDGKAYFTSDGDIYLEQIEGGSNLLEVLNMQTSLDPVNQQTWTGKNVKGVDSLSYTFYVTTTVAATKETALSTWDSFTQVETEGGNIQWEPTQVAEGSLVFKVNNYYKTVDIGSKDTFQSLINKLGEIGINASMSRGVLYIESGYDNIEFIENESTSSLAQLIKLGPLQNLGGYSASSSPIYSEVKTEVTDRISAVNYAQMDTDPSSENDNSTKLSDMKISSGKLTIYKNGQKAEVMIQDDDTISKLEERIQRSKDGAYFNDIHICFCANPNSESSENDGFLRIYSTDQSAQISVGSTSDESNFVAITGISGQGNMLTSSRQFYKVNENTAICQKGLFRQLGDEDKITTGSFFVGGQEIFVQDDTTMADIVSQINASDTSLAKAFWDNIEGRLVIKSTVTGASAVNIEAGYTNFTDVLGLTNNGNLAMDSQQIGKNAILKINGTTYTSLKNNVTSESTGLTGLTINLKGLTEGSSVTLTVKRDTETLTNAVQNVVDGYNELITNIDNAISKTGKLKDQSMLKLIRNNIRTAMTSSDVGTLTFKNLAALGIKSSEASAGNISTSSQNITLLSLNAEEFLKAFESDEEAVRDLLIGGENNDGIFTKVQKLVFQALSADGGYFMTANNAYTQQQETISKKIINGTAALEKYRVKLENKFSAMDIMIANMQNQFKSFLT